MSENLNGLKGWLILVAIIVCLGPPGIIYSTVTYVMEASAEWQIFDGSLKYFIVVTCIINVILTIISIYLIYLFFKKMNSFKICFIIYLGLSAILTILLTIWLIILVPTIFSLEILDLTEIFGSIIPAFVWIPYMIYSKRVKNTFIN